MYFHSTISSIVNKLFFLFQVSFLETIIRVVVAASNINAKPTLLKVVKPEIKAPADNIYPLTNLTQIA